MMKSWNSIFLKFQEFKNFQIPISRFQDQKSYYFQDFPMLKPDRTVNCYFRQNWAVFDIVYLFYLHPQVSYFDFFLLSLEPFVRNYQTWTIQRINEAEIEFPTDHTFPSKVQRRINWILRFLRFSSINNKKYDPPMLYKIEYWRTHVIFSFLKEGNIWLGTKILAHSKQKYHSRSICEWYFSIAIELQRRQFIWALIMAQIRSGDT